MYFLKVINIFLCFCPTHLPAFYWTDKLSIFFCLSLLSPSFSHLCKYTYWEAVAETTRLFAYLISSIFFLLWNRVFIFIWVHCWTERKQTSQLPWHLKYSKWDVAEVLCERFPRDLFKRKETPAAILDQENESQALGW